MDEHSAGLVIGRDEELSRLAVLVESAGAGRSDVVLIEGDAGVGKTSLLREAAERCSGTVEVVWATCLRFGSLAIPFLPLESAQREWMSGCPEAAPDDRPSRLTAADAPMQFDAWLGRRAARRPVLLVVDDLHWADQGTLDVLMYLIAGSGGWRPVVAVTLRSGEPAGETLLPEWLADVNRFPGVHRMSLRPLDRFQIRRYLAYLLGGHPSEDLVDEVQSRAEGNAYLTRLLVDGLTATATRLPPGLPTHLREAVSRAWRRLSSESYELMRLVAISGRPQAADRLADVARVAGVAATSSDEAVAAGVLVRTSQERLWFAHPLMAEAVVGEMLPHQRVAAHAAFVEVLDAEVAAGPAEFDTAADLSDHCLGAGRPEDAYRWALSAADAAQTGGTMIPVIQVLRRALDLGDQVPGGRPRRAVLERIRMATARAGDQRAELQAVDELLRLVDREAEPLVVSVLVARRIYLRIWTGAEFSPVEDGREAVRLSAIDPDSPEHAYATADLAQAELWDGIASGPDTADEAVRLARRADSGSALAWALSARNIARSLAIGIDDDDGAVASEGVRDGEEAQNAAAQAGDWFGFLNATFAKVNCIGPTTSPAVVEEIDAARTCMAAAGAPHSYLAFLCASEASGLLHLGRWRECEDRLRQVFGHSPGPLADVTARLTAALLACRQGRRQEADDHMSRAKEISTGHGDFANLEFAAVQAELALDIGDTEAVLGFVPDDVGQWYVPPVFAERVIPLAAKALAEGIQSCRDDGRDPELLRERLRQLRASYPRVIAGPGPGKAYRDQIRALQAWYDAECARGENADQPKTWDRLGDDFRTAMLPWDETYARLHAAEGHLRSRATRAPGVAALRRAHALATDLAAQPLLTRITALARSARVPLDELEPTRSVPAWIPGLTPRENEVLALIVAGRTYAEIAEFLFISPKTVSVHVSNLLRKTSTGTRVELAQLAHRTQRPPEPG